MAVVRINTYTRELTLDGQSSMHISASAVNYSGSLSRLTFRATLRLGGEIFLYSASAGQQSFSFVPNPSLLYGMPDDKVKAGTLEVEMLDERGGSLGSPAQAEVIYTAGENLCRPVLREGWAVISPDNDGTWFPADVYVKGSHMRAVFDLPKVQFQYGASPAAYADARWKVICGSSSVQTDGGAGNEDILNAALSGTGSITVACRVNDSRGFSAEQRFVINVYDYAPPMLSGIEVYRCGPDGSALENGGYIRVKADVSVSGLGGANGLEAFYAECALAGSGNAVRTALAGGEAVLMGAGSFSETHSYRVRVYALDKCGGSAEYTVIIPTANASFHILPGGKGAAFGKLAERENALDLGEWDLTVRGVLLGNRAYMTAGNEDPAGIFGGAWLKSDASGLPINIWQRTD